MKKLLLLPMMICLLLVGCQPDDGVDMPEPQQPVSEQIQGKWLYAPDSSYYYFADVTDSLAYDGIFLRPPTDPEIEKGEDIANVVSGSYALIEGGGKTYVELIDYFREHSGIRSRHTITTISDSKMIWEKESGAGSVRLEFTKVEPNVNPQQPVSELIRGRWYELSNTPYSFPDTYAFFNGENFNIYNEIGPEGQLLHYSITQQEGKTYIEYYDIDPATAPDEPVINRLEILHISDKKMTLKGAYTNGSRLIKLIRA